MISNLANDLKSLIRPLEKATTPEDFTAALNNIETRIRRFKKEAKENPPRRPYTPTVFLWEVSFIGVITWGCRFCQARWASPTDAPTPCPNCGPREDVPLPTTPNLFRCSKCQAATITPQTKCPVCGQRNPNKKPRPETLTQPPAPVSGQKKRVRGLRPLEGRRLIPNAIHSDPTELLTEAECTALETAYPNKYGTPFTPPLPTITAQHIIMRRWELEAGSPVFVVEQCVTGSLTVYVRNGPHKGHRLTTVPEDIALPPAERSVRLPIGETNP